MQDSSVDHNLITTLFIDVLLNYYDNGYSVDVAWLNSWMNEWKNERRLCLDNGKLNFLSILKQKLEKSDFQFLIKDKKQRVK